MSENGEETVKLSIAKLEIKTIPMICPWCNKVFKVSKWEVEFGRKTGASHGICDECYRQQIKRPAADEGDDKDKGTPA